MCLRPSSAVEGPLLLHLGIAVSDVASLGRKACTSINPTGTASVLHMLQDLTTARASAHFLLGTRSWRNTPVLVTPRCAKIISEILRCPGHEQLLRLPASMSDDGLPTYYTAEDDQ